MPISVGRRLQFCAGHRVFEHESKCRNLHGHNYVAIVEVEPLRGLDPLGRVIDFGVIKRLFADWIEDHWDHGVILWSNDKEAIEAVRSVSGQKFYLLSENPTAENLAAHLLYEVAPRLLSDHQVLAHKVILWETENCFAEVSLR